MGGELFRVNIEKTGIATQTLWDGDKISDLNASDELDLIYFMTDEGSIYVVEDFGEVVELESNIGIDPSEVDTVVDENHNCLLYLYGGSVYSVSTEPGSLHRIEQIGDNVEYLVSERGGIFALADDGSTLYYIDGDEVLTVTDSYDNSIHIYIN